MAATFFNFICAVFFLAFISQGCSIFPRPCQNRDVEISQIATGRTFYKHKTEFIVTIWNKCDCTVTDVELNCRGFKTGQAIDRKLLSISGDVCQVSNGGPVHRGKPVSFSYVLDEPFKFELNSFKFTCSWEDLMN